jgi:ubiquinone/menaquinone biosynthesis C-methylase UbiE
VSFLRPAPHERFLDIGTGTGEIALRAARAGADVTALDISAQMLEQARSKAARESLSITFAEGDVQQMPYADESFEVVASCFGLVFAPDRGAVVTELARVTRRGGRFGMTAWKPRPESRAIYARFQPDPPAVDHTDWGVDGFIERALGDDFDLELHERVWHLEAPSPEDAYEWLADSAPPTRAFLARLDSRSAEEFRAAMTECFAQFTDDDGRVREPRPYVIAIGRRR